MAQTRDEKNAVQPAAWGLKASPSLESSVILVFSGLWGWKGMVMHYQALEQK